MSLTVLKVNDKQFTLTTKKNLCISPLRRICSGLRALRVLLSPAAFQTVKVAGELVFGCLFKEEVKARVSSQRAADTMREPRRASSIKQLQSQRAFTYS